MKQLPLAILTAALAFFPAASSAENAVLSGFIEATGMGTVDSKKFPNKVQAKLLAKRAAKADAQRNLLESVEGVQVTSGTTVKDAQLESDLIANRVKGIITGAFVVSEDVMTEGDDVLAEVTLRICTNATNASCRGQQTLSKLLLADVPPTPAEARYQPPVAQATEQPAAPVDEPQKAYSGLILDVSGHDFSPAFDIRVKTGNGKEIYGPGVFEPTSSDQEFLHWARNVDAATSMQDVVGDQPLVVTAASISSEGNIIIADADAIAIYNASVANAELLKHGRVIVAVK